MTTSELTYVFCAAGGARPPRLRSSMPRLPGGGRARAIRAGRGLWLIAASVPAAQYDADAIAGKLADFEWVADCGAAHHGVIEAVHAAADVVPFRLFTLFSSDARAAARIGASAGRIKKALAAVRGREEWVLRLASAPPATADVAPEMSGAQYLAAKAASLGGFHVMAGDIRRARQILRTLGALAVKTRRRTDDSGALLIDAAFLIARGRRGAFLKAAKTGTRDAVAAGARLSMTGPWPPYSFVTFQTGRRG